MIKTWLIPIVVSTIIMVSLLTVNTMVFTGCIFLEGFLKQKAKAVLADTIANDVFKTVESIAEANVYSSRNNFSELEKSLAGEMERFREEILGSEEYFNRCGVSVQFNYRIETRGETCLVEIVSSVNVKDLEGFFTMERAHDTVIIAGFCAGVETSGEGAFPKNSS
ncbi:MAG: hypothetical protein QW797_00825 [Thermoproteota archaeon]